MSSYWTYLIQISGDIMNVLDAQLNKGFVLPFQTYEGSIPLNVPAISKDGRVFAGGNIVLGQRLGALQLGDEDLINGWGNNYFDLADLALVLEDRVKFQPDSPLLKGIVGVVETSDGSYVAVDARAVDVILKKGKYGLFKRQFSESEVAHYLRDGKKQPEVVSNVILFPYDGDSIKLTSDQFNAVDATAIKRKNIVHGRDLEKNEIVKGDKVTHPAWKMYDPKMIVPLVRKTFEHNKKAYGYTDNMGLYLPDEPQDNAEGRALCVGRLNDRSGLVARNGLGNGNSRSVGVASVVAEGDAR